MSKVRWLQIEKQLDYLDKPELIETLKGLFDLSADNRTFLAVRFLEQGDSGEALERCRKRIVDQFFPARGFGKLNLRLARQAIRDYQKTTSDLAGTIDLMLTYVEQGTQFTNTYGDIDERFYDSLESVLGDMADQLTTAPGAALYPRFEKRIDALAKAAHDLGWGYGDFVTNTIAELRAKVDRQ
jgi:hypothetical protein